MSNFDLKKAKILEIREMGPSEAKWIQLDKIRYQDAVGNERVWEMSSRKTRAKDSKVDAVAITGLLMKEGGPEIILQKQFRPPTEGVCIELPAGLLEANESFEECAIRELEEETGYIGTPSKISSIAYSDPGFCNTNLVNVQVNIDLNDERNQKLKAKPEKGEFIETFTIPVASLWADLESLEKEGYLIDARLQNIALGLEMSKSLNK